MKQIINPKPIDWKSLSKRPTASYKEIEPLVDTVFEDVKLRGDKALLDYTFKYDKVQLSSFEVSPIEIEKASDVLSNELKEAIQHAKRNIESFHLAQQTKAVSVETQPGVHCWQEKRPIEKIGLYIPGGSAPLFSTILMLAIPAKIAGCTEIILCTPPNSKGAIDNAILYTASICGISKIYKLGGVQAIAAMTFGTETISKVYKIFGPGNQYVTIAKQMATQYHTAIDIPAGPSELLVFADNTGNPAYIASDLLSQAEHGTDSQVIFVTTHQALLNKVYEEVSKQIELLPRKKIAKQVMANSKAIFFNSNQDVVDFVNQYGPEHYIICAEHEDFFISRVINAGSVFIGNYTPESVGDYASGTNHTLPTNGYTKQYSGVNLDSFLKQITFQKVTKAGIKGLGETVKLMAEAEGLEAHRNAVEIRLKDLRE